VDRKALDLTELGPSQRSGLEVVAAWTAWTLPILLGIGFVPAGARWTSDLEGLRDVGFIPIGSEGALSTLLCQLAALLPVGGRMLRASWLGPLALGVCSGLFFCALRRRLDSELPGRMNAVWALLASQIWAASPVAQAEAARLGSSVLALALLLAGVRLLDELGDDPRVDALSGGLVALTFAQSHIAGFALLATCVTSFVLARRRPLGVRCVELGVGLTAALTIFASWRFVRTLAPGLGPDLGWTPIATSFFPIADPEGLGFAEVVARVLADWNDRLGAIPLLLALAGALASALRSGLCRSFAPFALLVLFGALGPIGGALGSESAREFFASASSLALMAFGAVALRLSMHELWRQRVPLARPAAVLGSVFVVALVLSRIEARDTTGAGRPSGAEVWTEQALGALPANALLVVDSPPLALRLLAARVREGERPDIVVVPTALLPRGSLRDSLGRSHPRLAPLLRQLAVSGAADEFTLSQLADQSPLFVELDPGWDLRLLEHLAPDGLWLGVAPHARGALDRRAGSEGSREALWRVVEPLTATGALDAETRIALSAVTREQALLLAALGDREHARKVLHIRSKLMPRDSLTAELAARLGDAERGAVAIADLLD
jgi:hypothetical protein